VSNGEFGDHLEAAER